MADIANIGFRADTADLVTARTRLDALAPAAASAEGASEHLTTAIAEMTKAAKAMSDAANGLSMSNTRLADTAEASATAQSAMAAALGRTTTATTRSASASTAAAGATTRMGSAAAGAAAGIGRMGGALEDADAHVQAYRASLQAAAAAANNAHDQTIRFGSYDTLNAMRQLSDVGTTLAMGMNPFMVAIQQGPQLLDILQSRAAATGATLGAVFRAAGVQIWAALTPILIALAPIIAFFATMAVAFGLAARKISHDAGDVTKSMELSKSQAAQLKDHLDRLKDNKIDVNITGLDALKGFFVTAAEGFKPTTDAIAKAWNSMLDTMTTYGIAFIKAFYGSIQGANDALIATWQELPAAFADIFIQVANAGIDKLNAFIEWVQGVPASIIAFFRSLPQFFSELWQTVVNLGSDALTWLYKKIADGIVWIENSWNKIPGIIASAFYKGANDAVSSITWLVNKVGEGINSLGGHVAKADLGHIANPFAGSSAKAIKDGAAAFASGYDKAGKAIDDFGRRWEANSKKIAQQRILKEVGPHGADPKTPKGPKTDAEKFSDIVKGAENDIATQNTRAAATQLSAVAAATLEEKTKLLNEAQSKGIKLTDGMRAKIDELAAAYGKAKVAADEAIALRDILKAGDKDVAGLKAQAEAIGLTGRQLAYQTEMTKLLADAEAKKLPVDAAVLSKFQQIANAYADQSSINAAAKAFDDQSKSIRENIDTLTNQYNSIGLTATATAQLAEAQKLLNDEKYRGITYTPQQQADLIAAAGQQAALTEQLDKTKDALASAKDAAKGFFDTLISDLSNGKSVWQSFGDAVIGVLNKILTKLLDNTLNNAIDNLFSKGGSGGGLLGTLFGAGIGAASGSGAYGISGSDGIYAKGGVFDGGQKFAKGGAFTNSIVSKPTMFSFARGAAMGQMGEAGPEAIMPLTRGPDGSLGVQNHGGAGGAQQVAVAVTVGVEQGDMFKPYVKSIAQDEAANAMQAGIQEYDKQLPVRVDQIANDSRVRG